MSGSTFRLRLLAATAVPIIFAADLNGGITNFGFSKTTLREEYKAKPDYITGKVFVAHRQEFGNL